MLNAQRWPVPGQCLASAWPEPGAQRPALASAWPEPGLSGAQRPDPAPHMHSASDNQKGDGCATGCVSTSYSGG